MNHAIGIADHGCTRKPIEALTIGLTRALNAINPSTNTTDDLILMPGCGTIVSRRVHMPNSCWPGYGASESRLVQQTLTLYLLDLMERPQSSRVFVLAHRSRGLI